MAATGGSTPSIAQPRPDARMDSGPIFCGVVAVTATEHMYIYAYVHLHIYVCTCVYACIHTYLHTYMSIYVKSSLIVWTTRAWCKSRYADGFS